MQDAKKFILILNGPPDAMQPQVVKALLERPGRFHVSTNKIKFLISDYDAKTTDRDKLNQMVFDLAESARKECDYSLIVDGSVAILDGWWNSYADLAEDSGAIFQEANLEGPYDVLLNRFLERVARSQQNGTRISISTEAEFKDRYDKYQALKPTSQPTFDTSVLTPAAIAQEIEKLLS